MQPEKEFGSQVTQNRSNARLARNLNQFLANLVHVLGQILERVQTLRDEVQPFILHIPSEL
jgi:hypothetical protein